MALVRPGFAGDRLLWQVGTHAPTTISRNSEFPPQNKGTPAPGLVTRVSGDPEYRPQTNPPEDDDYYTAGYYPAGFNGLGAATVIPFDEPWSAWEGSLSAGDRTNRLHFVLSPEQVAAGSKLRLEVRYPAAFHNIGDVRQGFGFHDIVTRFKNGTGVSTVLDSQTVSEPRTVAIELDTSAIGATAGPNTIEFVRTGPAVTGHSYSIGFAYVRIQSMPAINRTPPVPVAGPVQTVNDVMRTSLPLSTHWKRSDIILSSRVYRRKPTYQMTYTVNGTSALLDLDTFGAADAFFANRMEWTYWYRAFDNQMLTEAQQRGMTISLTVNPNLPDLATQEPHNATYNIGRIKNINNAPAGRADYLLSGKYSGCARRPDFRSIWIDHVRSLISKNPAVVQSIQMDDVDMNIGFLSNGGCYCDVCNTGFRTYLATNLTPAELTGAGVANVSSFSYRDYLRNNGQDPVRMISVGSSALKNAYIQFQTANTLEFYTVVHHAITNHFQRRITFSANTRSSPKVIEDRHDIFLREFTTTDPGAIYDTFVTQAATDNKPMALTYDSSYLIPEYRRFAASSFAAGGHGLVPWDVYVIPEDYTVPSAGRFYGTQQDFSPIFGFVKAMSHYLDGYEDAGLFQTVRADLRYQAQPVFIENNPSASLFIRAKGGPQDPVVIHIIRKDPANTAPFTISLNPDAFFGTPIKKTLYTMRPYSATVHDTARSTKNFSTLAVDATTTAMADVRLTQIQIPSFDLWAILVLEPAGGGLVQPTILTRREMIEATQEVRIVNSGKGTIRYTLDGSDPGPTSALYNGPFSIAGARTIKARAFLESESTPVSSVTVRRIPLFDIAASAATKLWLRPDVDLKNLPHNSPVSSWTPTIGPLVRAPNTLLPTLIPNIPPVYRTNALRGAPGVYFDGTNCIAASGLMNNVGIPQAFTVVMTTYTDDPDFGLTGNGGNGGGGIPRFYMTRSQYSYGNPEVFIGLAPSPGVELMTVRMNTQGKIDVFKNGTLVGSKTTPRVSSFGSGGSFAVPWSKGHRVPKGVLGEVIVFNRALADSELESVHLTRLARLEVLNSPQTSTQPTPPPAPPTSPSTIEIEAENYSSITAPMRTNPAADPAASGGFYVFAPSGNVSTAAAPGTGHARYAFTVPAAGTYRVRALVKAPTMNSDSFWVRMDSGSWQSWNGFYGTTPQDAESFRWVNVYGSTVSSPVNFNLSAGNHTLTFGYREPNTLLDKIQIFPANDGSSSVSLSGGSHGARGATRLPPWDRQVEYSFVRIGDLEYLAMTYIEPHPLPSGILYRPKAGDDLQQLSPEEVVPVRDVISDGWRTVTVRDRLPVNAGAQRFLLVEILGADADAR